MSSYITRYCDKHGEWDQDIDDPYEECPECTEAGISPSKVEAKNKKDMQLEIERLKNDN